MQTNTYSPTWIETFLTEYPAGQTEVEVAFIVRQLPRPDFSSALDLCCGVGRHSLPLARLGYRVTGVDASTDALAEARRRSGGEVAFRQADMRDLSSVPGTFDAALCLWQSFGYFDAETNESILREIHAKLTSGGRFILDVYNRAYFESHEGGRTFERSGRTITETRRMEGSRLAVTLDYGPGTAPDLFDWQLYSPEELCELTASIGFVPLIACSGFDEAQPASPDSPRMQLVLQSASGAAMRLPLSD
jgi:SAM-dependent methyltransferase